MAMDLTIDYKATYVYVVSIIYDLTLLHVFEDIHNFFCLVCQLACLKKSLCLLYIIAMAFQKLYLALVTCSLMYTCTVGLTYTTLFFVTNVSVELSPVTLNMLI